MYPECVRLNVTMQLYAMYSLALSMIHSNMHVYCVIGVDLDEMFAISKILTKFTNQAKTLKYSLFHFKLH